MFFKATALLALTIAAPALGARNLRQEVDPRCVSSAPEGYGVSESIEMFGLQCSGCPVGEKLVDSGFSFGTGYTCTCSGSSECKSWTA